EGERRLVVEVLPLAPHPLLRLPQPADRFATPLAPFLAPGYPPLAFGQGSLGWTRAAWSMDHRSVGERGKGLQPQVDAGLLPRRWQRLRRYLGTGDRHRPPIGFLGEGDHPGCTGKRSGPVDTETSNLRQDEVTIVEPGAVSVFLVGEGGVLRAGLIAR